MLLGVNETVYIEFPCDHSWKLLNQRSVLWWWCFSYMEYNNTGMCRMEEGWWNDHRVEHLICLLRGCMFHESRYRACMPAKSLQSCPTLCDAMDCSPQGSSVHGFSGQEYWSELPCPPLGDLPYPGIKPTSLMFPELAGRFFTTSATWEAWIQIPLLPYSPLWIPSAASHT